MHKLFIVILLFVYCTVLTATNYYVNDGFTTGDTYCSVIGNNGNNGLTSGTPKLTITNLISTYALVAGDIVYIDAGTYSESFTITSSDDGSASGYVTFYGLGQSKTIITNGTANVITLDGASYVKFRDMKINSTGDYPNIQLNNVCTYFSLYKCTMESDMWGPNFTGMLDYQGNIDNSEISYCTFTSNGGAACVYFESNYTCDNNSFHHSKFTAGTESLVFYFISWDPHDGNKIYADTIICPSTTGDAYGFFIDYTTNTEIYQNTIRGGVIGIWLYNGFDNGVNSNIKVYNNFISGCVTGIQSDATVGANVYFNSIYASQYGIFDSDDFSAQSLKDWNIKNNIIYVTGNNSSYNCLEIKTTTASDFPATCDYNVFYHPNAARCARISGTNRNTLANLQANNHEQTAGNGDASSVEGDPKYSDPASYDLRLKTGSVALNVGTAIPGYSGDLFGTSREDPPEIGAFEGVYIPLPVELLNFNGFYISEDRHVQLQWVTASEKENDYFTIERSSDATNFEEIGTVDGAGNSSQLMRYLFTDKQITGNILYYKLKQTDFNGASKYSEIIALKTENDLSAVNFTVYPNPAKQDESINLCFNNYMPDKQILVVVYDITGNMLYSKIFVSAISGNVIYAFDSLGELSPGIYLIKGTSNDDIFNCKLVIQSTE